MTRAAEGLVGASKFAFDLDLTFGLGLVYNTATRLEE
jgi:hypothetical protein